MKVSRTLLALALAAPALAACDSSTEPGNAQATVRFVNATNDVAGLNFNVNGQSSTQGVTFGSMSQCVTTAAGSATFGAARVGATTNLGAGVSHTLQAGGRYTVVATGTAAAPQYLVLHDAAATPGSGRAGLRVVNAATGAAASDVHVTAPNAALGTASATNIGFNAGTTFLDVPAGQAQIRLTNAGTQTAWYTGQAFNLTAGQTSTVIISRDAAGTLRAQTIQPCP
jgi:hypothetical protein